MKIYCLNRIVLIVLLLLAIGSGLIDYFTPMTGDDLMFWNTLGLCDYTVPNRRTISFVLGHFFGCNGRLFDYMGPIITNLFPRWLSSAIMGAMSGLFFFSILYAARMPGRRHTALSLAVFAVTLAVMPWWDCTLRVCHFNYTWAAAFCLLFIGLFFRDTLSKPGWMKICGLLLLGIFAGASHEQAGVSMCAAFGLWCLIWKRYRSLSLHRRYLLYGLAAGTVLAVSSPNLWVRAAQNAPGYTPGPLIMTTLPILVVLLVMVAAMLFMPSGRRYVRRKITGEWGVLLACGVVSGIIAVACETPGRTGVLAESCSIVVLVMMILDLRLMVSRSVAAAVSCLALTWIVCHYAVTIAEQRKLGQEYGAMLEAYKASPDGIVYLDFTDRYDVSPLTLYRVKGVPDADDSWPLHSVSVAYGVPEKKPVVLPFFFKGRLETMTDSVTDGHTTVYSVKPAGCVVTEDDVHLQYYPGPAPRAIVHTRMANGREIWVASPRVRDPGDYELPVKTRL